MNRHTYPMTTMSFQASRIGRLQTLCMIPVLAGDSIELNTSIIARLSPLRRAMALEPQHDLFAFYVPHRHIYGQKWIDYLTDGIDNTVTFPVVDINPYTLSFTRHPRSVGNFLGLSFVPATRTAYNVPLHLLAGYNRIWNRFFRVPTDDGVKEMRGYGFIADDAFQISRALTGIKTLDLISYYGYTAAQLKNQFNTGLATSVDDDDHNVKILEGKLDVITVEQIKARYGSEQSRDFFAQTGRYTDLLNLVFGTHANVDADQRPTLLMHQENNISSHDVDGTGDTSLGTYSGKAVDRYSFGFPSRFFAEHGTIYIMSLLRFPPLYFHENHYIHSKLNPSYTVAAGDPRIVANQPPEVVAVADYVAGTGLLADAGKIPFCNWFRCMPTAFINFLYERVQGYPFLEHSSLESYKALHYCEQDYDSIFLSTPLSHAQIQSKFDITARRLIPPPKSSIFTGAN